MRDVTLGDINWRDYDFIDMGAGTGGSLVSAQNRIGGRGIGIDTNNEKVEAAKSSGLEVVEADIFSLPGNAQVRYVVFDNVLEHLPDLESVVAALHVARRIATEFIYIRHPSFEDEAYLAELGLKQFWTDWTGHSAHILLSQFMRMFREIELSGSAFHPVKRAPDSTDPTILPLHTPPDQHEYDASLHGTKPIKTFEKPVYDAYDIVALIRPGHIELDYRWDPEVVRKRPYVNVTPALPTQHPGASSH